jgi:hypothetical protein
MITYISMKIDINNIEIKKVNDNISQILHNNIVLKFWSPKILAPFSIDNEYDKYLIKLELNEDDTNKNNLEHIHLKKILLHIEKLIKKKLNIDDVEFKSIIRIREKKNDLIEGRIKTIKNTILTSIEYEDKDKNYLKTIFDLPKQSYVKVQLEIYGLWDYRNEKKDKNKVGLIIYVTKIIVFE